MPNYPNDYNGIPITAMGSPLRANDDSPFLMFSQKIAVFLYLTGACFFVRSSVLHIYLVLSVLFVLIVGRKLLVSYAWVKINRFQLWLILFAFLTVLTAIRSPNLTLTMKTTKSLLFFFAMGYIFSACIATRRDLMTCIKLVVLVGTLLALYTIKNRSLDSELISEEGQRQHIRYDGEFLRSSSTYDQDQGAVLNANTVAFYCANSFIFCLFLFQRSKKKTEIILWIACLAVLSIGVVLTGSRGAFLFTLIGCFLFLFYPVASGRWKYYRLIATIAVVVLILGLINIIPIFEFFYTNIGVRLLEGTDSDTQHSNLARIEFYKQSWELFWDRPLFGHGTAAFMAYVSRICEVELCEVAVSWGLAGIILFYGFYLTMLVCLYHHAKKGDEYAFLFFVWIICVFVINVSLITLYYPLLYACLALVFWTQQNPEYYQRKEVKHRQ